MKPSVEGAEPAAVRCDDSQLTEAAAWIVRLSSGPVNDAFLDDLEAWLSLSPGNRAAFERMNDIWRKLGSLKQALERGELEIKSDER